MAEVEIAYGAVVPLPPEAAFAFVSDPTTWPRFFDALESAEPLDGWGTVGGRGRMTTRFLGSSVTSELELTEWDPPRAFRYTAARQADLTWTTCGSSLPSAVALSCAARRPSGPDRACAL